MEVTSFDPVTGEPLAPGVSAILPHEPVDHDFPMVLYHQDGRTTLVQNSQELHAVLAEGGWEDNPAVFGVVTAPDEAQKRLIPQVRSMGEQLNAASAAHDVSAMGYVLQQWDTRLTRMESAIEGLTAQMHSDALKLTGYLGSLDVLKSEVTTLQAWVVAQSSRPPHPPDPHVQPPDPPDEHTEPRRSRRRDFGVNEPSTGEGLPDAPQGA